MKKIHIASQHRVTVTKRQSQMVFVTSCWCLSFLPMSAQETLGTSFGIPNSSPGVFWPRGSSVETLGFGRLYPNGPEFGLSNTSGGFGVTGTARMSGVGLAERSAPTFVQEQINTPYTSTQRLTDAFNAENTRAAGTFSSLIGNQFRSQVPIGSAGQTQSSSSPSPLFQSIALPTLDAILQDRPATSDSILKTGL